MRVHLDVFSLLSLWSLEWMPPKYQVWRIFFFSPCILVSESPYQWDGISFNSLNVFPTDFSWSRCNALRPAGASRGDGTQYPSCPPTWLCRYPSEHLHLGSRGRLLKTHRDPVTAIESSGLASLEAEYPWLQSLKTREGSIYIEKNISHQKWTAVSFMLKRGLLLTVWQLNVASDQRQYIPIRVLHEHPQTRCLFVLSNMLILKKPLQRVRRFDRVA